MVRLNNKEVGQVGYGLMGSLALYISPKLLTPPRPHMAHRPGLARPSPSPPCAPPLPTAPVAFNGGKIYGTPNHNSLQLLSEYFTKYPEDADKVMLSVKGGCIPGALEEPDGSRKNVARSIDECLKWLGGKIFLDLFEVLRLDPKVPVEEAIGAITEYVNIRQDRRDQFK